MKRWLFNLVAAVSLLLSLMAAAAGAMSYARPLDWHLLGIAHSADLTRVNLDRRTVVFMMSVNGSNVPHYGYWDALWTRSQSGRLHGVGGREPALHWRENWRGYSTRCGGMRLSSTRRHSSTGMRQPQRSLFEILRDSVLRSAG